jgi:plastocyanin
MRGFRALGAATAVAASVACAVAVAPVYGARPSAATHAVTIKDIDFHPARLVVHHGDTVRWSFLDASTSHNVTSTGAKRFHSSPTKRTGTYSVRFRHSGTYRYHCTIHPNMVAKVVVR